MRSVAAMLALTLLSIAAIGCGGDSGKAGATTSENILASATPSNGPTIAATPHAITVVVPPPIDPNITFHPLMTAWNSDPTDDTVITDAGDTLHVALSKAGFLWRFEPGERWTVSREDGTVRMSGTVAGEAQMYESVYGFVRLDDGTQIAYSYDDGGNWLVYQADEICASLEETLQIPSVYIRDGVVQEEALLAATCDSADNPSGTPCRDKMTGVVRGIAICVEQLGIDEHLTILPVTATPGAERRTGIEGVDAVVEAVLAGDPETLRSFLQSTPIACTVNSLGIGGPPSCRPGEADGTIVDALPVAGDEGVYLRPDEVDGLLQSLTSSRATLYAAYRAAPGSWPTGDYVVVLSRNIPGLGDVGQQLFITDGRLVGVYAGPGATPEQLVANGHFGELLLPPP